MSSMKMVAIGATKRLRLSLAVLLVVGVCIGRPTAQAQIAYVANGGSNSVSAIDTTSNAVAATVGVGTMPLGVAITPDGTRAYVTNSGDATVSVVDTAKNTVVDTIAVGFLPVGVSIAPDGARAYVTNGNDNTVSVIDTANNTVVTTVKVGLSPLAARGRTDLVILPPEQ